MFNTKEIIENCLSSINSNIEKIKGTFASLSASQLNWKPAPKKWSIGKCIDHLVVSNNLYLTRIGNLLNIRYSSSENNFSYSQSFMGNMITKAVDPVNVKKAKTFKVFYPNESAFQKSILDEYIKSSEKFIEQVNNIRHLNLKKIKFSSPVNLLIKLNLGDPLIIIPKHDECHLNQAERLMKMETFPKG